MEKIVFRNISETNFNKLEEVFQLLKSGKECGAMPDENIRFALGNIYSEKFWHPTKAEFEQHQKAWFSTPVPQRWSLRPLAVCKRINLRGLE